MPKKIKIIELNEVVVKFAGDSGDGMQMTGSQFSDIAALLGVDLSTLPDFPAEIRAPKGTVEGVSGFQIHIGKEHVQTPGDIVDVLVVMNPAALIKNLSFVKLGGIIIVDEDAFTESANHKAGFINNPLKDPLLHLDYKYQLIKIPVTRLLTSIIEDEEIDRKLIDKIKNQFFAGVLFWLFNRDIKEVESFLIQKFSNKVIAEANIKVLHAGYNYAETLETFTSTYKIAPPIHKKGLFRNINGNTALSWGLIAAAEKANKQLFIASYPITPATEILQELSLRKSLGVKAFQAEDEIAAVCSAIGASFAGSLAVTSTSGPGMSLKTEGIGMAVITELPLVVINVQRGGPSTGLPTKTEQSDLFQALYGRNGESQCVVLSATSPAQCFEMAYWASKIALEHMVPVILLSNVYLANGSELWQIPSIESMPAINPPLVVDNAANYQPYARNPKTLARYWAIPGQQGLRHHIGTVEKQNITGAISYDGQNHEDMVNIRAEKVERVSHVIPQLQVDEDENKNILVVGWGGTFGVLSTAVTELRQAGYVVCHAHFSFIMPLPLNTESVLQGYKKIIVCELNLGQFADYLKSKYQEIHFLKYNKIQGQPFLVSEIKEMVIQLINVK